jgi:cyclase
MKVQKVGNRGFLFTFLDMENYPTNAYLIRGKKRFFLCDTFLGPSYMQKIVDFTKNEISDKPFVIFNSHFHWDHIWGNCFFEDSLIVSHNLTREKIIKLSKKEISQHTLLWDKLASIKFPDCTFQEKILFPEDSVEFFYSPGHTIDSSSCLDAEDGILFVGDNLEDPIPYLECPYLEEYDNTLRQYKLVHWEAIIPGHGPVAGQNLLNKNHRYLQDLMAGETIKYMEEPYRKIHLKNKQILCNNFLERKIS